MCRRPAACLTFPRPRHSGHIPAFILLRKRTDLSWSFQTQAAMVAQIRPQKILFGRCSLPVLTDKNTTRTHRTGYVRQPTAPLCSVMMDLPKQLNHCIILSGPTASAVSTVDGRLRRLLGQVSPLSTRRCRSDDVRGPRTPSPGSSATPGSAGPTRQPSRFGPYDEQGSTPSSPPNTATATATGARPTGPSQRGSCSMPPLETRDRKGRARTMSELLADGTKRDCECPWMRQPRADAVHVV